MGRVFLPLVLTKLRQGHFRGTWLLSKCMSRKSRSVFPVYVSKSLYFINSLVLKWSRFWCFKVLGNKEGACLPLATVLPPPALPTTTLLPCFVAVSTACPSSLVTYVPYIYISLQSVSSLCYYFLKDFEHVLFTDFIGW